MKRPEGFWQRFRPESLLLLFQFFKLFLLMLVHGTIDRVVQAIEENELVIRHVTRGFDRCRSTTTGRLPNLQENPVCLRDVL